MIEPGNDCYQREAADAFNRQSGIFDALYSSNEIVQYKRKRVRDRVEKYLQPNSSILELNAGTGDDAIYFAAKGHTIHATDIAVDMQKVLEKKVEENNLAKAITTEICSFTSLENLKHSGPYDCIFSNFAGLNCTPDLEKIIQSFYPLLKEDGFATLVLMPPFCLWELMLVFKNDFKTAFRRFNSKGGRRTQVEGVPFTCWYYSPSQVAAFTKNYFDVVSTEALCSLVPPSFFLNFPAKHPRLLNYLMNKENIIKNAWPWTNMGDYFIITLQKK